VTREQLIAWLRRYESGWRMPGTEVLTELFTKDSTCSAAPYEFPHRGLEAIGV
jgi:hypothetical protein